MSLCLVVVQEKKKILTISERKIKGERMAGRITLTNNTNEPLNLNLTLSNFWHHTETVIVNGIFNAPVNANNSVQIIGSIWTSRGQKTAMVQTDIGGNGNADFNASVVNNQLIIQEV